MQSLLQSSSLLRHEEERERKYVFVVNVALVEVGHQDGRKGSVGRWGRWERWGGGEGRGGEKSRGGEGRCAMTRRTTTTTTTTTAANTTTVLHASTRCHPVIRHGSRLDSHLFTLPSKALLMLDKGKGTRVAKEEERVITNKEGVTEGDGEARLPQLCQLTVAPPDTPKGAAVSIKVVVFLCVCHLAALQTHLHQPVCVKGKGKGRG